MTNPIDTNQASEDKLRAKILTEFKQVHKLAPADYTENCTNVVMSIICTEKLKLLAAVRGRVVGEDERHDNGQPMVSDPSLCMDCTNADERFARNTFRADQRILLDKLEAEL